MEQPENTKGGWNDYFKLRGVTEEMYRQFRLPGYFSLVLPTDKDALICDIGCGFGQLMTAIRNLGYTNVVGVEPSVMAAEYATKQGSRVITGYVADAANVIGGKVEFAYMCHVLEHIPKDVVIPELIRIRTSLLAPSGALLIAVPNAQSHTGPYWRYEDWTHETLFTSGSLLHVLRAAGFSNVEILDPDCMLETCPRFRFIRRILLGIYKLKYWVFNKATASLTHAPSPNVFSFEVKAIARV